jgi:hypothetical protein
VTRNLSLFSRFLQIGFIILLCEQECNYHKLNIPPVGLDGTATELCEVVVATDETGTAAGDDDCADTDVIVFELSWRLEVELDVVIVLFTVVVDDVTTFVVFIEAVVEKPATCSVEAESVSNELG